MKTNYVLIDFENVQPKSLALLNGGSFKVLVFVGASQVKIPLAFAQSLQALGAAAEYIQISGNGANALDFHIAYMIGELATTDPDGYFHIISKDAGFDPLVEYLRKRKIRALRSKDIVDIPLLRIANATTVPEKIDAIVRNLASRGSGRPRKTKTLRNTINSLFLKGLTEEEVDVLVTELTKQGFVSVEKDNVTYHLPNVP